MRVAQGLALAASVREGVAEIGASRVADLASEVARRLGLPEHVQLHCRLGGLLRDVGKVALPDRVLLRARRRSTAEAWAVMRTHSAIGERIVLQNPLLRDAAPAVRHHHERWDGTGYPDGLAGDAIPIEARVVAACDAFGAMTSDRPGGAGSSTRTRSPSCGASQARSSTRRSRRRSATSSTTAGARRPARRRVASRLRAHDEAVGRDLGRREHGDGGLE